MKTKLLAIILTVALSSISLVAAASYLMTSPVSPDVVVNPTPAPTPTPQPATLSTVTVSTQTLTVGGSLTLTTTVSDHTEGITVTFYTVTGDINVGTAETDASGLATLTFQPPIGQTRYYATAVHP